MNDIDSIFQDAFKNHQSNELDNALHGYKQVLSLNPEHPSALHLSGLIEFDKNKNFETAETLIEKSLQLSPNELQWVFNFGKVLSKAGKPEQAISTYQKALSLDPTYSPARIELGNLYFEHKRFSEALLEYYRALSEDLNNSEIAQKYIGTLLAMNKSNEAKYFSDWFNKPNPEATVEVK